MLNTFAVMLTMKYTAPTLIEKQSGAIVVIASGAAYEPTAGNSAYVSSKYAVAGLTKCVAMELGPVGVHVNYICPGPVDTPMMLRIEKDFFPELSHEEAMAALAGAYAMDKRYAKPEEVADAVLYLASDVSAHTAGMGMHIDSKVAAAN
jgi:NAD(P)-dependent dehydrogenase (short-subunit alcohol dehydrogenase family)